MSETTIPADTIERVIESKPRDLGGFSVRRVLPSVSQRMVGPFVFFDHLGPVDFTPGQGIDVRPHPHTGLAAVTYLFEGELRHQDSIGTDQMIYPGAVNWMVAGRGVTHSERTSPETRAKGHQVDGIQTWLALPKSHETMAPVFEQHSRSSLPLIKEPGRKLRVILGTAYDQTSPVQVFSPMFYVDARLEADQDLEVPLEYEERAVYVASGSIELDGQTCEAGRMIVLKPGLRVHLRAGAGAARLMLAGGEPMDGPRFVDWNFVASSQSQIEDAKKAWKLADWKNGKFSLPPGDNREFIPLPE